MKKRAPQRLRPDAPVDTADGPLGNAARLDEALDHLYEEYASTVERWVWRLGGPRADIQDLLHDVFVVALRRRHEFRGEASPRTWLFRITHHIVTNRRRRDRVRRWLLALNASDLAEGRAPETPLDETERRERALRLYAALDRLPGKYRTAVILFEIEGMTGEQIAELLGEDVNAIRVRLHRGRAKLLAALESKEGP